MIIFFSMSPSAFQIEMITKHLCEHVYHILVSQVAWDPWKMICEISHLSLH